MIWLKWTYLGSGLFYVFSTNTLIFRQNIHHLRVAQIKYNIQYMYVPYISCANLGMGMFASDALAANNLWSKTCLYFFFHKIYKFIKNANNLSLSNYTYSKSQQFIWLKSCTFDSPDWLRNLDWEDDDNTRARSAWNQ